MKCSYSQLHSFFTAEYYFSCKNRKLPFFGRPSANVFPAKLPSEMIMRSKYKVFYDGLYEYYLNMLIYLGIEFLWNIQ
jgi:hypothetical protein